MASPLDLVPALLASRQLGNSRTDLQRTVRRLAAVRKARSDAGADEGTARQELEAEIRSAVQGRRNAQDASRCVQAALGMLGEAARQMENAGELARRSCSDALDEAARPELDRDFRIRLRALSDLLRKARYNGVPLFESSGRLHVAVGLETPYEVSLPCFGEDALEALGLEPGLPGLRSASEAAASSDRLAVALKAFGRMTTSLAASHRHLIVLVDILGTRIENLRSAQGGMRDSDLADEVVSLTKFQILNQSGVHLLGSGGAPTRSILSLLR